MEGAYREDPPSEAVYPCRQGYIFSGFFRHRATAVLLWDVAGIAARSPLAVSRLPAAVLQSRAKVQRNTMDLRELGRLTITRTRKVELDLDGN
jgi:hypothetical protein